MSTVATDVTGFEQPGLGVRYRWLWITIGGFLAVLFFGDTLPEWAIVPPENWTTSIPFPYFKATEGLLPSLSIVQSSIADWFNAIVQSFRKHEIFDLFTIRDITRAIGKWILIPLEFSESILISGFRDLGIPAIPWVVTAGLFGILGWYLKGWRLALLSATCITYFAVFGKWKLAMTTLSLVLVTAPIAFAIGLGLAIAAIKRPRTESILWPFLNLMQSLPHFGYLIPIVVFVGLGHKAGAVATVLFAFPPMAKLALVGLKGVSAEVMEAGVMAGCTRRQMLWKVRIPAARPTLLVGVNQVIMQCLAMVVIAAFVGAKGLGIDLLQRLQALQLGSAMESGIAIVLMAVTLDRLSHALAHKEPEHQPEGPFWVRYPFSTVAIAFALVASILAAFFPWMYQLPREMTISIAPFLDVVIKGTVNALYDPLEFFRQNFPVYVLIPIRDFFMSLPWTVVWGVMAFLGWQLGGWRMAAVIGFYIGFVVLSNFWVHAMVTSYLVFTAVVICVLLGFPLGVWASRTEKRTRFVSLLCDTFQTFPSFIYLIPVVMLFQVGNISQVMAIVIYASIPIIRYTFIGLSSVPQQIVEAALTSGCTRRQVLWKVRMPMAFPEIMLGLNQTVMFGLFMVMIAGFIGGNDDLARDIFKAKAHNDAGLGLLLALCVAFIGMAVDRLIQAWAVKRKVQLGLAA